MQQIISKVDGINEMAARSESQALLLLEKQTKLQEESLNNEKEFLSMFRSIANNLNQNHWMIISLFFFICFIIF